MTAATKKTERMRLKSLAYAYVKACVDLSWIGNTDPEDHDEIRQRVRKAREKLYAAIDRITDLVEQNGEF